ncbi:MAG: hypothetical protein JNJ40_13750 [Bacteroidia bacterium]|nr:hypothetical protein [Bacteroidia bacterium]
MLEGIGEIIVELFVHIFGEIFIGIIFEKGLRPFFKFLGTAFKFLFLFWRYSYEEVSKRKDNEIYGFLLFLALIVLILWQIFNE